MLETGFFDSTMALCGCTDIAAVCREVLATHGHNAMRAGSRPRLTALQRAG
jgi:hypothetical protein